MTCVGALLLSISGGANIDPHEKLTGRYEHPGETMSGNIRTVIGVFVLSILAFGSGRAAAADLIVGSAENGERDCGGSNAVINGNENHLTLKNCARVTVNGNKNDLKLAEGSPSVDVLGNKNTVTVDKAQSIKVLGNDNVGTWKETLDPKKKKPAISVLGRRSSVSQAK